MDRAPMETISYRGLYTSAIATYAEEDGSPRDAALVELVLRYPDGSKSAPMTPEHLAGSGFYYQSFIGDTTEQQGIYTVIWTITGTEDVAGCTHLDKFIVSSV